MLGAFRKGAAASLCLAAFAVWSLREAETLLVHEHPGGERPHVHAPHAHAHHHVASHRHGRDHDHHHHRAHRPVRDAGATRGSAAIGENDGTLASHWHATSVGRIVEARPTADLAPRAIVSSVAPSPPSAGSRRTASDAHPRAPPRTPVG